MNKLNCCLYRRSHIYGLDAWDEDKYYHYVVFSLKNLGKEGLQEYFMTWLNLFKSEPCQECSYFFAKIKEYVDNYFKDEPNEVKETVDEGNKEIGIDPERLWIMKCKGSQNCSICPFSLFQARKDGSGGIDKNSEVGKHLLEGLLEGQTKYEEMNTLLFYCPKCNQKWTASGEIPVGIKLAHTVNRGESYEGSKLTCFDCDKIKKYEM